MRLVTSLLCCYFTILGVQGSSLQRIHVDTETGYFADEDNRIILFHGINSVIKGFPWYDEKILDPARQREIADLGINVVRLGAMWTGVQPEEGYVNETYLDILEQIVTDFAELGVYTILDMHQDVLWQAGEEENNGYWGVPPWIKHKLDEPEHYFPWPFAQNPKAWECGYLTQEISQGFGQFFNNVNGVADDFAAFWKIVATRFSKHKSILGYELINEPSAGDVYKDLSLLLPGVAGTKSYQPLYERGNSAIREVDDNAIVFWEPSLYSYFVPINGDPALEQSLVDMMAGMGLEDIYVALEAICGELNATAFSKEDDGSLVEAVDNWFSSLKSNNEAKEQTTPILGPGFDSPPGGADYKNRTALSWHYYCWGIYVGTDEPYDPMRRWLCDVIMGPSVFNTVQFRRNEVGGGSFLTEFGVCYPNISNPDTINSLECNAVLEQAEKTFESWTYWDTAGGGTFWDGAGELRKDLVTYFSRPYPMATSGKPFKLAFDIYTGMFQYQFIPDPSLGSKATEIYLPPLHYTPGFRIVTSSNLNWVTSSDNGNVVLITNRDESIVDEVSFVIITPAK